MKQQSETKKSKRKISKGFIITIVIIIVVILGWAGLTRADYITNYLEIGLLHSGAGYNESSHFPGGSSGSDMIKKPVIYLYPDERQQINVNVEYEGDLFVTYPEYNNSWNVIADPNGTITNLADNREYSYLFWEGNSEDANYDLSTGFVVSGAETVNFLQEKLAALGLTPKEYNEFIVFWLPQMQDNPYNLIHFASKEEYDDRAVLNIDPEPDSMLRVFMTFKKLDRKVEVEPQTIKPFTRKDFTVVEWGGTEIK